MNQTAASTSRSRILLVDDIPGNLRLLAAALGDQYQLSAATSGPEALELAERIKPDLILLDVEMPGMDGHEVCRRLKRNPDTEYIPIMFITGRSSESDEILGLQLGAVDYLTKPFNQAIVRARVHTHLTLKRYSDLLQQHAYIDGLTGLPNRRRLEDYLDQIWRHIDQRVQTLTIAMIDIDHFKTYNDRHGHLAGDHTLRQVAGSLLKARRRSSDLLARFGGEEFIYVMPGANLDAGKDQAERFRLAVLEQNIRLHPTAGDEHLSISVGVACGTPQTCSAKSVIEAADQALYKAKEGGRNRVHVD